MEEVKKNIIQQIAIENTDRTVIERKVDYIPTSNRKFTSNRNL